MLESVTVTQETVIGGLERLVVGQTEDVGSEESGEASRRRAVLDAARCSAHYYPRLR